jgi:hypothetical protein
MPDGQAAVVERSAGDGHTDLQWWNVAGPPVAVGPPFAPGARDPAVSADGRALAYTQGDAVASTLVVRDLASGSERRWLFPDGHDLQNPSWGPEGRRLVLTDVAGNVRRTVVFDTEQAEGPVPEPPAIGGPFTLAAFKGAVGTLVAVGGPVPSGHAIVEVDPSTGEVRIVYSTPFVVTAIRPDVTGQHALLVTEKGGLDVWSNGSIYQVLAGVLDADW